MISINALERHGMTDDFPLSQWFDTSRRITKSERQEAEDTIRYYAFKDAAGAADIMEAVKAMYAAVKEHNEKYKASWN
jgi:hypothetical protein